MISGFVDFSRIPGFLEAVAREKECREFPFLGLPYQICGLEIRIMTLADFTRLAAIQSPFIVGHNGSITDSDIAAFLWMLSTGYDARDMEARATFFESVALAIAESPIDAEIAAYLEMIFFDNQGGGGSAPTCALETSIVDNIASEYGWTEEDICAKSLPKLFGYINRIRSRIEGVEVTFNRLSDKVRADFLAELNKSGKRKKAKLFKSVSV